MVPEAVPEGVLVDVQDLEVVQAAGAIRAMVVTEATARAMEEVMKADMVAAMTTTEEADMVVMAVTTILAMETTVNTQQAPKFHA